MEDVYAFAAFVGIAVTFDWLEKMVHHIPEARKALRVVKHALLIAPWLPHACRDFAIHALVYSRHAFF